MSYYKESRSMSNRNYKDYIDKVLKRFADDITDHVLLMIQDDKELIREYYGFVADGTDIHSLNCQLGKQIKDRLYNGDMS